MARRHCRRARRVRALPVLRAGEAALAVSTTSLTRDTQGEGLKSPDSPTYLMISRGRARIVRMGQQVVEPGIVRPDRRIAAALILAAALTANAAAQETMSQKLSAGHVGGIEPGSYVAADSVRFTLDP